MCGIGGYIASSIEEAHGEELLRNMGTVMQFRGPDAIGEYQRPGFGLVHRRLKIIDMSDAGNQPMKSSCGNYMLVFNGEIYNYLELARIFNVTNTKSITDTEILLECLAINSVEKVLQKCLGMFAFALINLNTKELVMGRDRFGQKPLYYSTEENGIYFCSDIRGVKPALKNDSVDQFSIDYYLSELCMPQPRTIYTNVKQIPPGEILRYSDSKIVLSSYYKPMVGNYDYKLSTTDWIERIEDELSQSIIRRSKSDVSQGYFLSGGVDSGLIVALAAKKSAIPIKTYTVGSEDKDVDESEYAKKLSDKYQTEHTVLQLSAEGIDGMINEIVQEYSEPFADSSAIPSHLITKSMKKHATVAISGDGGDELFDYPEYNYSFELEKYKEHKVIIRNVKSVKAKVLNRLTRKHSNDAVLNYSVRNEINGQLLNRKMGFLESEKKKLFKNQELLKQNALFIYHSDVWNSIESDSYYVKKWYGGFKTRLLNDYLVKVDRASMMSSLEVRSPFLDHKLFELVSQIPPEKKTESGHPKYLLKKLGQKYIDKDILNRKKKGFGIPLNNWINNDLKELINDHLSEAKVNKRGIFNYSFIQQLISEHNSGSADHRHKIWALFCLEIWMSNFID